MKKLLSIITLIAILATAFYTVPTSAATNSYYDQIVTISKDGKWGYIYLCEYNDGVCINDHCKEEIAIVDYRGNKTKIVIPENIDGHTVIGVGDFYYEEYGGEVDDISLLFANDVKITKVTLPKTIRQIGEYIHDVYYDNDFKHGVIQNRFNSPAFTFFKNSITEYVVDKNNPYFSSEDGVLYNKDKTQLIIYPAGKKDEVFTLPENTKSFCDFAFAYSKLKRVKNFDHIKELSDHLFVHSELEEFPKMENLKEIEDSSFSDCDNLKSVTIPLKVDKIGYRAFYDCKNLEEVDFGEITTIKSTAFAKCISLKKVVLPKTCTTLKQYAFSHCKKLESFDGSGLTSIGPWAFNNCKKLESFNCNDLSSIEYNAFENCVNLKKINSENYKNKLNANSIGSNAFQGCASLENLTINTKSISVEAFKDCSALKDISLQNSENITWIGENAFKNTAYVNNHKDGVVYIDDIAICYKKPAKPETYIEIKEGTKYIADSCLYKLDNLKAIYLPSSLNNIGEFNLRKCKNLKRVYIAGENTVLKYNVRYLPEKSGIKYYVKSNAHNIIEIFKEEKYNYTTNWDPEKVKNEETIKAKQEVLNEKPNTSEETTSSKNETVSQNKENTSSKFESETESTVSSEPENTVSTESTISTENETENNDMKKPDVKPKNNPLTVLIITGSILLCIAGGLSAFFIYNKKRKS